jgi:hypothetical protein
MQIQWREYLVSEIRRKLRTNHNIFESDREVYERSQLKKIVLRFEFILNNFMREFVQTSINDWVEFIKSFTKPNPASEDLWRLSMNALLTIRLSEVQTGNPEADKKKRTRKGDESEKSEKATKSEKKIRFKPSLQDCGQFFQDCLKSIREATNSFIRLEKDLVTFLPIEPMPAFELQQDFCWLQDASQNLEDLYKVNCIGPN